MLRHRIWDLTSARDERSEAKFSTDILTEKVSRPRLALYEVF